MTEADDDEAVGYGRPPRHSRFKKGQSGNPRGRRKGSRNVASVLIAAAQEQVIITENGRRRKVTKLEAAAKQLANKAASGDQRAVKMIIEIITQAEVREDAKPTEPTSPSDRKAADGLLLASMRERLLNNFRGDQNG